MSGFKIRPVENKSSITVDAKKIVAMPGKTEVVVVTELIQGPSGPAGSNGDVTALINDITPSTSTAYSSVKTDSRIDVEIDDIVGDEDLNFTLLFQNALSQGG